MKAIQVSIDGKLLQQLDADPDVCRDGRSAVLRRTLSAYLSQAAEGAADCRCLSSGLCRPPRHSPRV